MGKRKEPVPETMVSETNDVEQVAALLTAFAEPCTPQSVRHMLTDPAVSIDTLDTFKRVFEGIGYYDRKSLELFSLVPVFSNVELLEKRLDTALRFARGKFQRQLLLAFQGASGTFDKKAFCSFIDGAIDAKGGKRRKTADIHSGLFGVGGSTSTASGSYAGSLFAPQI